MSPPANLHHRTLDACNQKQFFIGDRKEVYRFSLPNNSESSYSVEELKISEASQYAIAKLDCFDRPVMLDYVRTIFLLASTVRGQVWASESAFNQERSADCVGTWQIREIPKVTAASFR
jgi:hypothetical protein